MPKVLEVIVISVEDAIEAEAGGADRLELVRALDLGGLTPAPELVKQVVKSVKIPVRVMLRQTPDMSSGGPKERAMLKSCAEFFAGLPIDGLVLGFIRDGKPDIPAVLDILSAAPGSRATFHRAFDELTDPMPTIQELKRLPQIDRILTVGGQGEWPSRKKRLSSGRGRLTQRSKFSQEQGSLRLYSRTSRTFPNWKRSTSGEPRVYHHW